MYYYGRKSVDVQKHRMLSILITKTTATQNDVPLSYHKVRGLYFKAVIFAAAIDFASNKQAFRSYAGDVC